MNGSNYKVLERSFVQHLLVNAIQKPNKANNQYIDALQGNSSTVNCNPILSTKEQNVL